MSAATPPQSVSAMRFLIVEDHGFQRWAVGRILEGMGAAHVLSAPDGNAALELLRTQDQPIDLANGSFRGAEAVARWRHPTRGLLAPKDFIGTIESSAQAGELTFLMLQQAAQLCREWRSMGVEANVSVNVPLVSLIDLELADR